MLQQKTFDGALLKELRMYARPSISQDEMAKRLGLSRKTVSRIENNMPEAINALSLDTVQRWQEACNPQVTEQVAEKFRQHIIKFFDL